MHVRRLILSQSSMPIGSANKFNMGLFEKKKSRLDFRFEKVSSPMQKL